MSAQVWQLHVIGDDDRVAGRAGSRVIMHDVMVTVGDVSTVKQLTVDGLLRL
jgi:hypothetical protein